MADHIDDQTHGAVHRALTDLGLEPQFASAYSAAFVRRLREYGVQIVPLDSESPDGVAVLDTSQMPRVDHIRTVQVDG